jgi:hypothetical protein
VFIVHLYTEDPRLQSARHKTVSSPRVSGHILCRHTTTAAVSNFKMSHKIVALMLLGNLFTLRNFVLKYTHVKTEWNTVQQAVCGFRDRIEAVTTHALHKPILQYEIIPSPTIGNIITNVVVAVSKQNSSWKMFWSIYYHCTVLPVMIITNCFNSYCEIWSFMPVEIRG